MTYRELLAHLQSLTTQQLDKQVMTLPSGEEPWPIDEFKVSDYDDPSYPDQPYMTQN